MDNIKTLATEWWRSKDLLQRTHLRKKYKKGVDYKYYIHTSIQDILEMYEAEHTSIRDGVEPESTPLFDVEQRTTLSQMHIRHPAILNSVKFYEDQIEEWEKRADKLRCEIKELETKSTWSKEEVKRLMVDSFNKGLMAESFSLPIDFDADKWIEEEINKTNK